MMSSEKSSNLEDTVEEEICLGHLIENYKIVCENCKENNIYCPYYIAYSQIQKNKTS